MFDIRSGYRPNLLCPQCGEPVFYTGDIDTTARVDKNRSRARSLYLCKEPSCSEWEQEVEPRQKLRQCWIQPLSGRIAPKRPYLCRSDRSWRATV
jgi:hypothetical protein